MRRGILIGMCVAVLATAGLAAEPWNGPGGGGTRTGVADAPLATPLMLEWRYLTDDATWTAASPVATEKTILFAVGKKVYALDPVTGNKKWEFVTTGVVNSAPTIDKELVVFGDHAGMVYCLDLESGRQIFSYRAYGDGEQPVPVQGGFAIVDDVIYFGNDEGMVHRVRARANMPSEPGRALGMLALRDPIYTAPTYSRGTLYVATLNSLVALHDLQGSIRQRWSVPLARGGSFILASPVVADDRVLVAVGRAIVAINADTSDILWTASAQGVVVGAPAVKGDRAVFADVAGVVTCVSVANGQPLWQRPLNEGVRTGSEFEFDRPSVQSSVVIAGDQVYARSRHGTVAALRLSDGAPVWRYKVDDLKGETAQDGDGSAGGAAGGRGAGGGSMGGPMGGSMGGPMGAGGSGGMGAIGGPGTPGGLGGPGLGAGTSGTATSGGKGVTGYSVAEDLSSGLCAIGTRLYVLGGTGTLYCLASGGVASSKPYVRKAMAFVPDNTGTLGETGYAFPVFNERGEPDRDVAALPALDYVDREKLPSAGPIVFQLELADLGVGLDPTSIKVTLEGPMTLADPLYFESKQTLQVYLPTRDSRRSLDPGDYVLKVSAANYAKRTSVHEIRFTIDTALQSPAATTGAGPGGGMGGPGGMPGMGGGMGGGGVN